jgi:hypothetical protein
MYCAADGNILLICRVSPALCPFKLCASTLIYIHLRLLLVCSAPPHPRRELLFFLPVAFVIDARFKVPYKCLLLEPATAHCGPMPRPPEINTHWESLKSLGLGFQRLIFYISDVTLTVLLVMRNDKYMILL